MQSNRTTPSRVADTGTSVLLLLLGILLVAAALYFCLSILRPQIETDLNTRVTDALQRLGLGDDNITVAGQDVMLAGTVDSEMTREKAQAAAAGVFGVARVYNNLRLGSGVVPANPEVQQSNTEDQSNASAPPDNSSFVAGSNTGSLGDNLVLDESLAPSTLDISVVNGRVNIQGIVPDEATIERIVAAVSGKFGASNVEDDMSTFVGSAIPRWLDGAVKFIDQIDGIEDPFIRITHSGAIIGGTVDSTATGQQKATLAKQLLSTYLDVTAEFSSTRPTATSALTNVAEPVLSKSPAWLKISDENGTSFVTGSVGSNREARAIRDGADNLFSAGYEDLLVVDNSIADAPWIAEAIAVANSVRNVNNFSVSIGDGQMQLGGDITDTISARALASAATDITAGKLRVVNDFTPTSSGPVALSGEELLAEELQRDLDALDTAAIVFKIGSTTLTDNAKLVLNDVADIIMNYRNLVVEIAGHTDSSGDALANLELSRKRAIAVQEYLVDRQVPQARLRPIGYGETKPIADNLTPQGQAANRRIEFKL